MDHPTKRLRQLSLLTPQSLEFGGSLLLNKRKSQRILATKRPIHLVLKGDIAKSKSLRKNQRRIKFEIEKWALKFEIKLYRFSINSNHIHLNILISTRENYRKFIRALSSRIAQITKIKFTLRPYTKILSWGREFKNFLNYTIQNYEEAIGSISYKQRLKKYSTA